MLNSIYQVPEEKKYSRRPIEDLKGNSAGLKDLGPNLPTAKIPTSEDLLKTEQKDSAKNPLSTNSLSNYANVGTGLLALGQIATSKENYNDGYDGTGAPPQYKVNSSGAMMSGAALGMKAGQQIGSSIPVVGGIGGAIGGAVLGSLMGAFKGNKDARRAKRKNRENMDKYYSKTQQEREVQQRIEEGMESVKNRSSVLKSELGYNVNY